MIFCQRIGNELVKNIVYGSAKYSSNFKTLAQCTNTPDSLISMHKPQAFIP